MSNRRIDIDWAGSGRLDGDGRVRRVEGLGEKIGKLIELRDRGILKVHRVFVPQENRRELRDIDIIRNSGIEIRHIDHIDEAIKEVILAEEISKAFEKEFIGFGAGLSKLRPLVLRTAVLELDELKRVIDGGELERVNWNEIDWDALINGDLRDEAILIIGEAGIGKSTALMNIERNGYIKRRKIPLRVSAYQIGERGDLRKAWIEEFLNTRGRDLRENYSEDFLKEQLGWVYRNMVDREIILLDGLDERVNIDVQFDKPKPDPAYPGKL